MTPRFSYFVVGDRVEHWMTRKRGIVMGKAQRKLTILWDHHDEPGTVQDRWVVALENDAAVQTVVLNDETYSAIRLENGLWRLFNSEGVAGDHDSKELEWPPQTGDSL